MIHNPHFLYETPPLLPPHYTYKPRALLRGPTTPFNEINTHTHTQSDRKKEKSSYKRVVIRLRCAPCSKVIPIQHP